MHENRSYSKHATQQDEMNQKAKHTCKKKVIFLLHICLITLPE